MAPSTRSKKKASPYKALKTPARSPRSSRDTPPKAKSGKRKRASRIDRMEEQIAALTSLLSAQLVIGNHEGEDEEFSEVTPEAVRSPPRKGGKKKRRDRPFPPPPQALADEPGLQDQIDSALQLLNPSFKPTGGKKAMVTKPHLYIPKLFRSSKTSEQENVPFPQFVTGMAGMVLAMLGDQSSPAAAACRHLREAAEDHITRPWSMVREWSKTMFDRLNIGEIAWDDYDEMLHERIKLCFSAPPKVPMVVPCPYFSAGNCEHSACHDEGDLSLRHICPFCYASGAGRQDHPIFKCNSKKAYTSAPRPQFKNQPRVKPDQLPPKN